jgi:uncharacterized pyridoxal phosphate-containing UPF0001 family protein
MSSKSTEIKDIEEIAQQAHLGADVSEHFTGHFQANQQINITFPLELLRSIDAECQLQKVNREDWIKIVCAEKIREIQSSKIPKAVNSGAV